MPSAADAVIEIGDEVLNYRENPIEKWIGPYLVTHSDGRTLRLDTGDCIIDASVGKMKKHHTSFADSEVNSGDNKNNDERVENIISLLLPISAQTASANIIDTEDFVVMSDVRKSDRAQKEDFIDAVTAEIDMLKK